MGRGKVCERENKKRGEIQEDIKIAVKCIK